MAKKIVTYAFIDCNNVYQALRHLGWQLDWVRFRKLLKDKYSVVRAYVFIGYIQRNNQMYLQLHRAGFILIFKQTLTIKRKGIVSVKGNVDAELVLYCARGLYRGEFDKAVIVTSDGDFFCLIQELANSHKLARLIVPNKRRYSSLLFKFREYIDFMNEWGRKIGNKNAGVG